MVKTLVTGFAPFDGRAVNASWIAARSLASRPDIETLELPVSWTAPRTMLTPICERRSPEVIISMGEGREGWFDIETRARNTRKERTDNDGRLPNGRPILEGGQHRIEATIDAGFLHGRLTEAGFPVRISRDAGAFLCEETLYTLEMLRRRHARLRTVVFVHLPPFGTLLRVGGEQRHCGEELLTEYSEVLLEAVHELHSAQIA